MHFLNPIFLWGLLGLSIPIGIHLLSRKEGKIIKLGSLRHLQETSTKQFKGIKLNELVLLSLRCLLIVIFCLLLSGLLWNSAETKKWVVIEKGLESQNNLLFDSLEKQGYELHWLSRELPPILPGDTSGIISVISYRQALDELDKHQVSEAIVFARNDPNKFSGARVSLPSTIRWISVVTEPKDFTLYSLQFKPDSSVIRKGRSEYMQTTYTDEKIASGSDRVNYLGEINVQLISDDDYQYDKRIMKAALEVIGAALHYQLKLTESSPDSQLKNDSSQWIIWLSDKIIPKSTSNIISMNVQLQTELFVQKTQTHWSITKRITEETVLRENLTLRLAELITAGDDLIQKKAKQYDRRMIPDSIAWSGESMKAGTSPLLQTSASPWLLAMLFFILVTERIIAYHRNQ